LVDDRALDARDRVRLELDVAVRIVALDRADQAEQPVRDEVVLLDVGRQAAAEAARDELDEGRVREDEAVAHTLVAVAPELAPEADRVFRHSQRIRARSAESSLVSARPESAHRERPE